MQRRVGIRCARLRGRDRVPEHQHQDPLLQCADLPREQGAHIPGYYYRFCFARGAALSFLAPAGCCELASDKKNKSYYCGIRAQDGPALPLAQDSDAPISLPMDLGF